MGNLDQVKHFGMQLSALDPGDARTNPQAKRRRRRARRAVEAAEKGDWETALKYAERAARTSELYNPLVISISAEITEGEKRRQEAAQKAATVEPSGAES